MEPPTAAAAKQRRFSHGILQCFHRCRRSHGLDRTNLDVPEPGARSLEGWMQIGYAGAVIEAPVCIGLLRHDVRIGFRHLLLPKAMGSRWLTRAGHLDAVWMEFLDQRSQGLADQAHILRRRGKNILERAQPVDAFHRGQPDCWLTLTITLTLKADVGLSLRSL